MSKSRPTESAMLEIPTSFADCISDPHTEDVVFKDVTLLAEGTWTDKQSRKTISYSAGSLAKMKIDRRTIKMVHDIYDSLPITNEIGIAENMKYVTVPSPRWLGDVRIFPTNNGRDITALLRRKKITQISPEVFHDLTRRQDGTWDSSGIIFMGAAPVREGACTLCTFNEGDKNMADEDGKGEDKNKDRANVGAESAGNDRSSEIAALEARVAEAQMVKTQTARLAELEKQVAELAKAPVIRSQVSKRSIPEVDSGEWASVPIRDFADE